MSESELGHDADLEASTSASAAESDSRLGLVARMAGRDCPQPACAGELVSDTYKGNDAAVCGRCAVPTVCVWGDES